MTLTDREREIVALLRAEPMIGPADIAARLDTSRAAVNVHLSNLGKKGAILGRGYILRDERAVVVIGGANLDIKARSAAPLTMGTSNPGTATMSPGGVGRNVAEGLARLGTSTHLICGIGRDAAGDQVVERTREAGVHLDHVLRTDAPTGTYTAVLDDAGELVAAVSAMSATDHLGPEHLTAAKDLLANADLVVLDGNLPAATLAAALDLAGGAGVPCLLDPVSVPKAARLAPLLDAARPVFAITPNRDELEALSGMRAHTDAELLTAAEHLQRRGVRHVWVRLGGRGSLLTGPDGQHHFLTARPTEVVDVTGAGDAMLAAFAHAILTGLDPVEAARHGHAAAAVTVASTHTVRPDLTPRLVQDALDHPTEPLTEIS